MTRDAHPSLTVTCTYTLSAASSYKSGLRLYPSFACQEQACKRKCDYTHSEVYLFIFKICPLMFFRYFISSYWCSCVVIFNQLKHLTNSGCRYTFQSRRKNGKRDFQGLWHISGHHLEFLFLFIAKLSHWHHF